MLGLEIQKKKSEKYTKRVDQMLKDYELSAFRDCDKLRIAGTKVCNYEYEVRNHSYGIL